MVTLVIGGCALGLTPGEALYIDITSPTLDKHKGNRHIYRLLCLAPSSHGNAGWFLVSTWISLVTALLPGQCDKDLVIPRYPQMSMSNPLLWQQGYPTLLSLRVNIWLAPVCLVEHSLKLFDALCSIVIAVPASNTLSLSRASVGP